MKSNQNLIQLLDYIFCMPGGEKNIAEKSNGCLCSWGTGQPLSLTSSFPRVVHLPAPLSAVNGSRPHIVWGFLSFFLFHSLLTVRRAFKWKINENICFLEACHEEACPVFLWACAVRWKRVVGRGFIEMNGAHRARDIFGLLALIVVFLAVEICHEGNCCNCFFFVTFPFRYF